MVRVGLLLVAAACTQDTGPPPQPPRPPVTVVVPPADARTRPTFAVIHALPGIDILESSTSAIHTHGGPPASVSEMQIRVRVTSGAHTAKVTKLELLKSHCRETTWASRKPLVPVAYEVHDWDHDAPVATGTAQVALPPQPDLYAISVRFAAIEVYQVCDRFGFAVTMLVDGTSVDFEAELSVTREEPLR